MTELDPDRVMARLDALRTLAVVPRADAPVAPEPADMRPEAVLRRLEDLRELCRLTDVLHRREGAGAERSAKPGDGPESS